MRPLTVEDSREMVLALQDEIRRSEQARYDHRLHGVLLVAQGMSAPKVAQLLGDGVRTVEYWIERFNNDGLAGFPTDYIGTVRNGVAIELNEASR